MRTTALIVAAGRSERFGGSVPKQYLDICGRPLLSWTISRFESANTIDEIILIVGADDLAQAADRVVDPFGFGKVTRIVSGGGSRQESVCHGLDAVSAEVDLVAIHDGARPLVAPDDIDSVITAAAECDAAMLAAAATDTVKRVEDGVIFATLDRQSLYLAQTPQVFSRELIVKAHQSANDAGHTDDSSLVEATGHPVRVVVPSYPNLKVTQATDLVLVEALLREEIDG